MLLEFSLFADETVSVSEWMSSNWGSNMSDNLGFGFSADSLGDLLNLVYTVNQVDNMALLNWGWDFYDFWVVYAVFRDNFVAR